MTHHNRPLRFCTLVIAAMVMLMTANGCSSTTSTGTKYTMGINREIQAVLRGNLETVHNTAKDVLENYFGFNIIDARRDALEGIVEARNAKNNTVRVETYKQSDGITKIEVFVGPLGKEGPASQILSQIETSLPKSNTINSNDSGMLDSDVVDEGYSMDESLPTSQPSSGGYNPR